MDEFDIPENKGTRNTIARLPDKNHNLPLTVRFFGNSLPEERAVLNQINNKNGIKSSTPNSLYTQSDIHWLDYNDIKLPIKCPRSYGEKCPLCEQMFAEKKAASGVKSKWEPERGFVILAALSNDPTPYVFRIKSTVKDLLFGREKPKIDSELRKFEADYEQKVLNYTGEFGWFEISKSGAGKDTRYAVQPVLNKIKEKGGLKTVPKAEPLHPDLLELIKNPEGNLPRLSEQIKDDWHIEELEKLVESDGTWIPDRYKRLPKVEPKWPAPVPQDPNMLGIDMLPDDEDDGVDFK